MQPYAELLLDLATALAVGLLIGTERGWSARDTEESQLAAGIRTFGLVGLLDIASEMGLERTTLDFGLTLGRWGVPDGPYLMLPLLGPPSLRDTAALTVDGQGDALSSVGHVPTRNEMTALRIVDKRAGLLRAGEMLEQAALDRYSFVRDSYLQRRQSQTGRQPPEERYDLE